MRANDAVNGAIVILFAAAMMALTASFPAFPGQKYGPSLFPRLLGGGLIICGALLVWRGLAARREGRRWLMLDPWMSDGRRRLSFLVVLGGTAFYILAAEPLGFIPTSLVILGGLLTWFGVRPIIAGPVALGVTLLVHYFFGTLMRVPLPRGILDPIL